MVIIPAWRWCNKCQGLWLAASGGGSCPAGGNHFVDVHAGRYGLWGVNGGELPPPNFQDQWKWCHKCQAAFYGPNQGASACPSGGQHDGSSSGNFAMAYNGAGSGQPGWSWCHKCQGMFTGANQASSHCAAGGTHNGTGSFDYKVPWGPFPEQLNVVYQNQSDHFISMVSSPDGTMAHMGVWNPSVFGGSIPQDQSGGVIAVCQSPYRTFYACRSNEGGNTVMIGSVGIFDSSLTPPVSTGLGIIGDPNPSAPALAYFQGKLYLFYRTWYQGVYGYGQVSCAPLTILDGAGHFSVGSPVTMGDQWGGGRITAVATQSQLWCSWIDTANPNADGWLYTAYSTDGQNWTGKSSGNHHNSDSAALLALPSGQIALGWRGPNNGLYVSMYHPGGGGYWPEDGTQVPGVTLLSEPAWMTSADNSSVFVAARGVNNDIRMYKLNTALTQVLDSGDVTGISMGSAPALLCLFSDGEPSVPPP